MDVQTIALHELGHWLDLRDLYGDADDVKAMYGFCSEGVVRRSPTAGDVAGITWIYANARADTRRPWTQVRRATVKSGRKLTMHFRVNDAAPSIGLATVTIRFRDARGRLVGAQYLRDPRVYTNTWYWLKVRCPLRRGVYRMYAYATDIDGHRQSRVGWNYLIVR